MVDPYRQAKPGLNRSHVIMTVVPVILMLSACTSTKDDAGNAASDPARLPGRYLVDDDAEHPVDILPDGTSYTWQRSGWVFRDRYTSDKDTMTFTGESCDGATGTYRWSFEGESLVLTAANDPCADRSAVLNRRLARVSEQIPFTTVQPSKFLVQPGYNFATVDSAGDVYTTDGKSGFYKYHQDGSVVSSWPDALTYTVGITVDSRGNIYVSNFDDATIRKFDRTGRPLTKWTVDGGRPGPNGLAHDTQDNIYVALDRFHDHYVEKYTPGGRLLASWATTGEGDGQINADGATQIAVDKAGNSYVADPVNNRIVSFGPDGRFRYNISGNAGRRLNHPSTVAVDSHGNLYTDSGLTIWKFDRTGTFAGQWFTPLPGPLLVDARDRVLQVDAEIRLLSFPAE